MKSVRFICHQHDGVNTAFDAYQDSNERGETPTRLLAATAPEAATAGSPIPGKVESPQQSKPVANKAFLLQHHPRSGERRD